MGMVLYLVVSGSELRVLPIDVGVFGSIEEVAYPSCVESVPVHEATSSFHS